MHTQINGGMQFIPEMDIARICTAKSMDTTIMDSGLDRRLTGLWTRIVTTITNLIWTCSGYNIYVATQPACFATQLFTLRLSYYNVAN